MVLSAEGLVVLKPRRGAMVREMDLDKLTPNSARRRDGY